MDAYATHIPMLATVATWICRNRPNPIIFELGCGLYSTPLLKLARPFKLVSFDTDQAWIDSTKAATSNLAASVDHAYVKVNVTPEFDATGLCSQKDLAAWDASLDSIASVPDLIFIDNRPGDRRKYDLIRFYALSAAIIVTHDTEEKGYGMAEALSLFKHRYDLKCLLPWTTAVSNSMSVKDLFV